MPLPHRWAALGFSQPLGGFGRDDDPEPELPRTHDFRRRYAPERRGLVSCRRRPWDSPFRAFPSRRAVPPSGGLVLPCGFVARSQSGAKAPVISDRFHQRAPPQPPRRSLAGAAATVGRGDASSPRPSFQAAASNARVAPHANLRRPTGTFGHHRLVTDPPASKPCSPRESVRRPTAPLAEARAPELAPPRTATDRAVALLGFRPFRAFSATTSGSFYCESRPGRTGRSSEDHTPLRRGARRFDPEV